MRTPRPSAQTRAANAAANAVICEQQRVAGLASMLDAARRERVANNARCAELLDLGGYADAAAYLRALEVVC